MQCKDNYQGDRTCDMYKLVSPHLHAECKDTTESKLREIRIKKELFERIRNGCPYRKVCWDEYTRFMGCVKDGDIGRHTPTCKPELECEKYLSDITEPKPKTDEESIISLLEDDDG